MRIVRCSETQSKEIEVRRRAARAADVATEVGRAAGK